jgi:hypothetical protein
MFLVMRVLLPHATTFADVQESDQPRRSHSRFWKIFHPSTAILQKWKEDVERQQDLYLPSGVKCLTTLREVMVIDDLSVLALADAICFDHIEQTDIEYISEAQKARLARLVEWRTAAARVAVIAEYRRLRRTSQWATYLGSVTGLLGVAFVIACFASFG